MSTRVPVLHDAKRGRPRPQARAASHAARAAFRADAERASARARANPREPLSPELVLISPHLRLKALDALPERPWEAFLPPPADLPPVALADVAAVAAEAAAAGVEEPAAPPRAPGRRLGRDASLVGVALIVGFIAADLVPRSSQPSLAPANGGSPTVPASIRARAPSSGAAPVLPTMVWSRDSNSAGPAARRGNSGLKTLAVARGGYVAGRSVRFQVAPDRRSLKTFVARVKCDRRLVVHGVRLHGGRRFGYRGRVSAGKAHAVRVQIVGRFLNTYRVRGFVRARSAGCDSGKVRFIARLS